MKRKRRGILGSVCGSQAVRGWDLKPENRYEVSTIKNGNLIITAHKISISINDFHFSRFRIPADVTISSRLMQYESSDIDQIKKNVSKNIKLKSFQLQRLMIIGLEQLCQLEIKLNDPSLGNQLGLLDFFYIGRFEGENC